MDLKDNWTVIQTSKLIASYKTFPNLWDINHKYYKNKGLRKNCLRNIAQQLSNVKPGININDVRAKLKTLRSQYGKEKRRRDFIVSKRGENNYEPKLWCYKEIKFIDNDVRAMEYNSQDEGMKDATANSAVLEELLENESSAEERRIFSRARRVSRFPAWKKQETITLLRLLKQNPLIYDITHPLYANNYHRTKAFRDMLVKLKSSKPNVTIPDMRTKLKTLRSQYLKEKHMLKASMERRGRVKYIPKLWCFQYLTFLDERGKYLEEGQEECTESMQDREFQVGEQPDDCYVVENENEIYVKSYDDCDDGQKPMALPERIEIPRSFLHQKCLSLVESLTKQMQREQESSHDYTGSAKTPQALLGKMVESELSKVSETVFEDTKWKIIRLLEEASQKNKGDTFHKYLNGDLV